MLSILDLVLMSNGGTVWQDESGNHIADLACLPAPQYHTRVKIQMNAPRGWLPFCVFSSGGERYLHLAITAVNAPWRSCLLATEVLSRRPDLATGPNSAMAAFRPLWPLSNHTLKDTTMGSGKWRRKP